MVKAMLFNSVEFFIFFPVVTVLFFVLPYRYRWFLLLAASCYFYMQFIPIYILILFFTILVDYVTGLAIEGTSGSRRRLFFLISIVANVGVLVLFKYLNFLNGSLSALFHFAGWQYPIGPLSILLPIGLSFHTFQSLSYTIEVYRGSQKAEHHLGILALYVMFYPQLVAGPIERPQNMLHQYREEKHFDYQNVTDGLKLMAWGLFKKVVIADRMAVVVNQVYRDPASFNGLQLIIGTICFAYQIYCDFSGYSDMAIGAAQVMGYKFTDNFKQPYWSRSITEFWRRWHITLSNWLRDYIFFPLRRTLLRRDKPLPNWLNLVIPPLITMTVSGIWHGANWTFVIWGFLHGFYLIVSALTEGWRARLLAFSRLERFPRVLAVLQTISTFALVTFAWIFFRAPTLGDALYIVSHLFSGLNAVLANLGNYDFIANMFTVLGFEDKVDWMILAAAVVVLECVQFLQQRGQVRVMLSLRPAWQRWILYYSLLAAILILGMFNRSQFIYFQF